MAIDFNKFNSANKARMGEAAEKPRQVESGSGSWATIFNLGKAPYELKFWKPTVGTNYIDIIPLEVTNENNPAVKAKAVAIGDYDFGINIWTHRGNDASNNKPHVCLRRNYDRHCPRCDAFFETYEKGVQGSGNENHGSTQRNYMIVVPRPDKDTPGTEAFLWDAPAGGKNGKGGFPILERAKEMADGDSIVFFWWPTEDGRTVSFDASPGAKRGSFDFSSVKFHKRPVEVAQALATKFSFPLDSLLIVNTADEMNRDIYGGNDAPAEEEPGMHPDAFGAPMQEAPKAAEAPKAPAPIAASAPAQEAPKAEGGQCPYGHAFAKQWDKTADCKTCEKAHLATHDSCMDAA
jgi:hypothetical protein